ncbi:nucleoside deaminase [Mycoplasma sp. P36-A1]|uniref:nucleoside deaminase n=1 Tax=Mycoplasma sp. P36-A1 TaxID=3252900 RepID=UPI003C2AC939
MNDLYYMNEALKEAKIAFEKDEVPVGAVIVYNNKIIARAHNTNFSSKNSLNHAEINAIDQACKYLNTSDLSACSIYVSLEPCMMCHGALINAKIKRVYFGAFDLKKGSIISNQFFKDDKKIHWTPGLLQEEAKSLLKEYFTNKRRD